MAFPDDISDPATEDEWASSRIIRLPQGDRSLAGTRHEGGDFMFAELAGVDLTEADFYWAMFHNATLEGAILARCDLRGARFNETNLRHADLSGANCGLDNLGGSTDFIKADLSGADLRNANLGGADQHGVGVGAPARARQFSAFGFRSAPASAAAAAAAAAALAPAPAPAVSSAPARPRRLFFTPFAAATPRKPPCHRHRFVLRFTCA